MALFVKRKATLYKLYFSTEVEKTFKKGRSQFLGKLTGLNSAVCFGMGELWLISEVNYFLLYNLISDLIIW